MNFTSVDDVLTNVRQIVRKCPNPTLRRAYTRAMREWCHQTQWLRITLGGETLPDEPVYTLGTDPDLDVMAIRAMSITRTLPTPYIKALAPGDSTTWNPNAQHTLPRQYCYVPEGRFALYPVPDAIYPLTIGVIVSSKESATAGATVPSAVLTKYSNDIEAGALAYLLAIPGEPWTDLRNAGVYDRMFRTSIANGKNEVQRAYNTGSMRVRPRPFVF